MTTQQFARGARPTPQHKLLSIQPFQALFAPAQAAWVPGKLNIWGNDTYGDCVSAEEAFAKACYNPEIFIDPAIVIAWAKARGYLDGANLTEVMDSMQHDGFKVGNQQYNDGGYQGVDYSNETVLNAANALGPVKIAIDADALPQGAGNVQGWFATNGGRWTNTDHCVALSGYGTAGYLYDQLKVSLPGGLSSSTPGRLVYTWATIGFVTQQWLMGTCTEAYVRNPTTIGNPPLGPPDPNPTQPSIVLSQAIKAGQMVKFNSAKPAGNYVRQVSSSDVIEID